MQGPKSVKDSILKLLPQKSIKPETPHSMERRVHHELLLSDSMKFASVIVHRIQDGVCLEGYLIDDSDSTNACQIAKKVRGVNKVLNHLMIKEHKTSPGH